MSETRHILVTRETVDRLRSWRDRHIPGSWWPDSPVTAIIAAWDLADAPVTGRPLRPIRDEVGAEIEHEALRMLLAGRARTYPEAIGKARAICAWRRATHEESEE